MLILVVPFQTSPQKQRLQIYLWTSVIVIIYSVLISIFRVKNRGVYFYKFCFASCLMSWVAYRIPIQVVLVVDSILNCEILCIELNNQWTFI